jgi:hypothetical protein
VTDLSRRDAGLRRVLVCLAVTLSVACGDALTPHGALTGTWAATRSIYSATMTLAQVGDSVTGGGSLHTRLSPPDMTFTVGGHLRQSTATLTFHYGNGVTTQFTGSLVFPAFLTGREIFADGTSDSLTYTRE